MYFVSSRCWKKFKNLYNWITRNQKVIASDGLWDVMDEDDCARIVVATMKTISNKSGSLDPSGLKRVPQNLVDVAKSRGSADNITAMVIFL